MTFSDPTNAIGWALAFAAFSLATILFVMAIGALIELADIVKRWWRS